MQLRGALLDEASEMTGNVRTLFVNNPGQGVFAMHPYVDATHRYGPPAIGTTLCRTLRGLEPPDSPRDSLCRQTQVGCHA